MSGGDPNSEIGVFLEGVEKPERRSDAKALFEVMAEETGLPARIWSGTMVGFGAYRYRRASGREDEWFRIGFAPRAQGLSLYLMSDFLGEAELLERLGKHKMGKCCLTFKRMADLDLAVLRELVAKSARGEICSEVT